ncbi:MAG TPA: hypothetical protein ENK91_14150 [Bacteroidetes bacterium]|nr:hypothetical protein [Bacteroidota bacterium]
MAIFFYIVNRGERGGDTFFSNLKLTIPILLAAFSGIASFLTGLYSVFKNRDFSVFIFLSTLIGGFVLFWVLAEIISPH